MMEAIAELHDWEGGVWETAAITWEERGQDTGMVDRESSLYFGEVCTSVSCILMAIWG